MSNTIPTVAYGFIGPDAIRIFLQLKGYQVSLFKGDLDQLDLREDKPERNVVLLPNFAKLPLLEPVADQIAYLIVLTKGRHDAVVERGIPLLDSYIDQDGVLQQAEARRPEWFVNQMKEVAVEIALANGAQPKLVITPEKPSAPTTLDAWFNEIEGTCYDAFVDTDQFERDVEFQVCGFLTGELSQNDFKRALKKIQKAGGDNDTLKSFYHWLTKNDYADRMASAMRRYQQPASEDAALPPSALAKQQQVDARDIELLDNIYTAMQKPEEQNDDA